MQRLNHQRTSFMFHLSSFISAAGGEVVPGRLELPTSTLSVWRSNQLSYRTGTRVYRTDLPSVIYSLKQRREYKRHG